MGDVITVCVLCTGTGTDHQTGGPCPRCRGTLIDPNPT